MKSFRETTGRSSRALETTPHTRSTRKWRRGGWCWRPPPDLAQHVKAVTERACGDKKREGTRSQHKAFGESTHNKIQNHVKDGQCEAKVQNDVMGETRLRCTNAMAWKPLETRPHRRERWRPAAAARPCLAQGSAGMIRGKTARDLTQGPIKKRADLPLVKEQIQQQARTGEDWLRQEEWHTRAMMCWGRQL